MTADDAATTGAEIATYFSGKTVAHAMERFGVRPRENAERYNRTALALPIKIATSGERRQKWQKELSAIHVDDGCSCWPLLGILYQDRKLALSDKADEAE
jgi:hypothetical protein